MNGSEGRLFIVCRSGAPAGKDFVHVVANPQSAEDKDDSEVSEERNVLAQNNGRHNKGDNGLKIHVIVGFHRTELLDGLSPEHVCDKRSADAEEKHVSEYFGTAYDFEEIQFVIFEYKERNRSNETVEECFA